MRVTVEDAEGVGMSGETHENEYQAEYGVFHRKPSLDGCAVQMPGLTPLHAASGDLRICIRTSRQVPAAS